MNISKVSTEFATDLIELINSCKGIKYNANVDYTSKKTGQRTKFSYVTLDKIYTVIKANNNFALLEPLGTNEEGQPALQIILIHKSGESITSDYYVLRVPEDGSKQDEGAAITYTKRYAVGSFLGICTDEDNDANPERKGMGATTPPKKKEKSGSDAACDEYRLKIAKELKAQGIDMAAFAKEKGISKNSDLFSLKNAYMELVKKQNEVDIDAL